MRDKFQDLLKIVVVGALLAGLTSVATAVAQDSPVGEESPPTESRFLTGRLTADSHHGPPLAGIAVDLVEPFGLFPDPNVASVVTNTNGEFALDITGVVLPELYGVAFQDPAWNVLPALVSLFERGADLPLNTHLLRSARLSGVVSDTSGEPVAGISFQKPGPMSVSDEDGQFEIVVPAGASSTLRPSDPLRRYVLSAVSVPATAAAETRTVNITAENATAISGTLVDVDDTPVAGEQVRLQFEGAGAHYSTTDALGAFVFEQVPALPWRLEFDGDDEFDASRYPNDASFVDPSDSDVEVGSLTVRRFPIVRGTVTNPAGEPLADIEVQSCCASTSTDLDGSYELRLPPGATTISFSDDGQARQYYDESFLLGTATELDLAYDTVVTGVDDVFTGLTWVTGVVRDTAGEPIAGIDVLPRSNGRSATTDIDGAYRIEFYSTPQELVDVIYFDPLGRFEERSETIPADLGVGSNRDVVLERPARMSGQVTNTAGHPLPGIRVTFDFLVFGSPIGFKLVEVTDAEGRYELYDVPISVFGVSAVLVDFVDPENRYTKQYWQEVDHPWNARPIEIVANEEIRNIDAELFRASTLTGRITDFDGQPIEDARVSLFRDPHATGLPTVRTDQDGSYVIHDLPPGTYTLTFDADGYEYQYWDGVSADGTIAETATYFSFGEGSELSGLDVRLAPFGAQTCSGELATVYIGRGDFPTDGPDVIVGTEGNDLIDGRGGDDVICGGGGNDLIAGGAGNDTIFGGAGIDWINGGAGNDFVYGEAGADALSGGAGGDILAGGDGEDLLAGGAEADILLGGSDNDWLSGGAGNDWLVGQAGEDECDGGGDAADWIFSCEPVAVG